MIIKLPLLNNNLRKNLLKTYHPEYHYSAAKFFNLFILIIFYLNCPDSGCFVRF